MPARRRINGLVSPGAAALLEGSLLCLGAGAPVAQAQAQAQAQTAPVRVTVTDGGCQPNAITVAAGRSVFMIKNSSGRAVEWEILKGTLVVEERENIIPGFEQSLTATLEAGDYAITCGRLSNPKGVLRVTAAAAPAPKPAVADLVGPIAEYKRFVVGQVDLLAEQTRRFTDAVKRGDVAGAKELYAPTRVNYERIEPIAELFSDLDAAMDAREDDFEKKAADPRFTGFHRIEKGLFADGSAAGLAPLADKLMNDVHELRKRIDTLTISPKTMVGGAAELIEEIAAKKISGEEDRYSRTDLWDFNANLEGSRKIVALLRPVLHRQDAGLDERVEANFAKIEAMLAKYRAGDHGFASYDKLSPRDRTALKGPITRLAEDLSKLRGTLGVD